MANKTSFDPNASPTIRPEAELESRLATALSSAFPNIPRDQMVEQRRFVVRLGHETREFDSTAHWEKWGRADILISHGGRALAVLEIKREDLALTDEDYQQAQSYANQLTPRPPLVVVTNGNETRIYDSNTGERWSGEDDAASAVEDLFTNAATIATANMDWAIEALMGRETGVWVPVMRESTDALLSEMTDEPGESKRPFARELLFPRRARALAEQELRDGLTFTIVEGAPSIGKSSLLRELAVRTQASEDLAMLMMRGTGPGLFQSLANLFATELNWALSADDARKWLQRMSKGPAGPILVVAIDGVAPGTPMATDLEELAGLRPGSKLRVILTTDQAERLINASNMRTTTALGAHATRIELTPLDLEEFLGAQEVLRRKKILFHEGAEHTEDYRAPWVMRTIYDSMARHPHYSDPDRGAARLPASLGLELVDAARNAYSDHTDLQRGYRLLARDFLADSSTAPPELALAISNGFVIKEDALSSRTMDALAALKAAGWARSYRHACGEDIVAPTAPAAFLVELASAAGAELGTRATLNGFDAGVWLGQRLSGVYLGDIAGAQAIRSLADRDGGFSLAIIEGLLSIKPEEELLDGALIGMAGLDGETLYMKVKGDKAWLADRHGNTFGTEIDISAERPRTYANMTPWMILGLLASLPTAVRGQDSQRLDAKLLLDIGQCPFPLLRASIEAHDVWEHNIEGQGQLLCADQGAIEATTQAIADLLSRAWDHADAWVDAALEKHSLPLAQRVLIALETVQARSIPERSAWAHHTTEHRVRPAIMALLEGFRSNGQNSGDDESAD